MGNRTATGPHGKGTVFETLEVGDDESYQVGGHGKTLLEMVPDVVGQTVAGRQGRSSVEGENQRYLHRFRSTDLRHVGNGSHVLGLAKLI